MAGSLARSEAIALVVVRVGRLLGAAVGAGWPAVGRVDRSPLRGTAAVAGASLLVF